MQRKQELIEDKRLPSSGNVLGERREVKGSNIFFFSKHALYLYESGKWVASRQQKVNLETWIPIHISKKKKKSNNRTLFFPLSALPPPKISRL